MAKTLKIEESTDSLKPYIQSGNLNFLIGSGASYPAIKLAGNIEAEINALLDEGKDADADLLCLEFIENLESENDIISLGLQTGDTQTTLGYYTEFLKVVDHILFERKNLLLPRQANIFTTNYDTFVEQAGSELPSIIINDGFDRASALNGYYYFAPEQFSDRIYRSGTVYRRQAEVPTINLVKIHGSLTWFKGPSVIKYNPNTPKKLKGDERQDQEKVSNSLKNRGLILPNLKKFNSTLTDRTYYDLLRVFANSMELENSVLIAFGFSFADEHIRDIIKRALRNPTSQLIIFAYNQKDVENFESLFSAHRNVIIVAPKDDEPTGFKEFTSLLDTISPKIEALV